MTVTNSSSRIGDCQQFRATELVTEAHHQAIAGLLDHWARHQPETPLTNELKTLLAPALRDNAVHALRLVSDTVQVVELLENAGMNAIVLKGPLLSRRYYGDYGIRNAGDVDILVAEENVVHADRVLRDAGYPRCKPVKELTGRRLQLYLDTQHEFGYRRADGSGLVELHWRFADCRLLSQQTFAELWQRSEEVPAGPRTLRTLGPVDTLLQLASHGATDGWSGLKWIADLPRVHATLTRAQVEELHDIARRQHTRRILQLALAVTALPGGNEPAPWLAEAWPHVQGRIAPPETAAGGFLRKLAGFWRGYRYLFALCETTRQRAALLYANLITPADFDRLPLPDVLTPALPYLAQCGRGIRKFNW